MKCAVWVERKDAGSQKMKIWTEESLYFSFLKSLKCQQARRNQEIKVCSLNKHKYYEQKEKFIVKTIRPYRNNSNFSSWQ